MTSHDSQTTSPEAFALVPSLVLVGTAICAGFVVAIIAGLVSGTRIHHVSPWQVNLVQLAFYVGIGAVLVPALPRVAGRSLEDLGLRAPRGRQLLWGLLGAPVMLIVTSIIGAVLTALYGQHEQAALRMLPSFNTPGLFITFAFVAAIAAPFFEELFFRGLIFNALAKRFAFWPAAALSGLAFALAHGDVWALMPLWGVGLCLAYIYSRSRSLWASMLTHSLFNSVSLIAISLKDHLHP
ncbi:CPBP family intramembrane metalloprotease [bacterium]|nr:MAG: CPBP family intramembrane metalloprotease [bacterium]